MTIHRLHLAIAEGINKSPPERALVRPPPRQAVKVLLIYSIDCISDFLTRGTASKDCPMASICPR